MLPRVGIRRRSCGGTSTSPARTGALARKLLVIWIVAPILLMVVMHLLGIEDPDEPTTVMKNLKPAVAAALEQPVPEDEARPGPLRGTVLPVDLPRRRLEDGVLFRLPPALRPRRPEEVGTVAYIDYEKERVGSYVDEQTAQVTGSAYRMRVTMTVVDAASRTVIAREVFLGDQPEEVLSRTGDAYGGLPFHDLVRYLEQLERAGAMEAAATP